MSVCRTCLSKNDLMPIFPDKDHVIRAKQLLAVTGIKIEPNDGLPQVACALCINLITSSLKLRELSSKTNEFLQNTLKNKTVPEKLSVAKDDIATPDISNVNIAEYNIRYSHDIAQSDISKRDTKKIKLKRALNPKIISENDTKGKTISIEDFESDDDGKRDIIDDLDSDSRQVKVCIEDFESSDSFDEGDISTVFKTLGAELKEYNVHNQERKEKELLHRGRRKIETKMLDKKLLSLAVTPYDPGGPIRCTLCATVVKSVQNFKTHARGHFGIKDACEECGKKFMTVSHVRYHQQRVHGRTKRLSCTQCDYRAVDLQQLQNHERVHSGERPFCCDVCGDSFRMRRNIVQHMRKHFGVKYLQCERCPSMFRSSSELCSHQSKVHDHIYTYDCYLCQETYKRASSVKKHLINIHGVSKSQQLKIKCVKTRRRNGEKND